MTNGTYTLAEFMDFPTSSVEISLNLRRQGTFYSNICSRINHFAQNLNCRHNNCCVCNINKIINIFMVIKFRGHVNVIVIKRNTHV